MFHILALILEKLDGWESKIVFRLIIMFGALIILSYINKVNNHLNHLYIDYLIYN